jgi:hypothetical protein
MKRLLAAFAVVLIGMGGAARADDEPKPLDPKFAANLFAGKVEKNRNYACFVRVYDAAHLARHRLQKVKAMKLLVNAETDEESAQLKYSFRLGVNFVNRQGNFDSSGDCGAGLATIAGDSKAQIGCGVDCDGGGISIELTKDNKATLVRLERIRIWKNNKPEDEGLDLSGGADDRIFRLDRASLDLCKALITDRKELAAVRTLKK